MTVGPDVVSPTSPIGDPEAVLSGAGSLRIEGRSLGRIAWTRLKRDRVAMAGGAVVLFLVFVAIFAPLIVKVLGHPPNDYNNDLIDPNLGGLPKGSLGGISGDHLLGVVPVSGRDLFSRIVYGARVSLTVAFLASVVSVVIGGVLGVVAGYFGGLIDAAISRLMDLLLAFPQLLFTIALVSVVPNKLFFLTGTVERMAVLIMVIGFFGWPYIGRIIRGQTLSLREREFIDASRSLGATSFRVVFKELLPNLVAPILVYATLVIPTNILTEAALDFLSVGVQPPTASWGQMFNDSLQFYQFDPMYMIIPGATIFICVLAFNLFGDGLRDALDPKSR